MRKHLWTLATPLILTLVLTGCSIVSSAGGEESEAPARRLDPAAWPTPQPTEVPASPTPFPKITLPPAATPTPILATSSSESGSETTSASAQGLKFTGNISDLVQQVTELSGGFSPVAAAAVNSEGVAVRHEPAESATSVGAAEAGELAAILGRNESGDWLYTLTRSGLQGWLPVTSVNITFTLKEPPILPPDPLADKANRPVETRANIDPLGGLEPAAVALVMAKDVTVRQGPSVTYPAAGSVGQGELAGVLGVNSSQDWLYIITISGTRGWLPANTMRVTGSLAEARVLPANPLAINPIPATPASLSEPTASSVNAAASQPVVLGDLSPVTKARVNNQALNLRQGPGAAYQVLSTLSQDDQVTILALNKTEDWVLVKTTDGQYGWASLAYLAVDGSITDAPRVISPAPDQSLPADQVAPAFPTSFEPGTRSAIVAQATGVQSNAISTIVFQTASAGDIMAINPDGTGLRRLTHGIDPVLSPNGQTVAFTRWAGETGMLWLIDVSGANERAVLGETRQAKHPSWSPDGQQIVVNFQHEGRLDPKQVCENLIELGGKNPNIPWNVDPDSVEVKIKDRAPYLCWKLPPDPHWGLRVVNLTNGGYEDMPSDAYTFGPEWDPANAWRVVSSGLQGLVQLDVNRREDWALTTQGEDHTPAFSPDGRYIAVAFNNNGQYDIHRLNSDGSGRVPLTKTPLWITAQPGEQKPWNNVSPAWSPDGSRITFLTDRTGRWEIWVMNADGSNQRPMFPEDVNDQLLIAYNFVDERMISWR